MIASMKIKTKNISALLLLFAFAANIFCFAFSPGKADILAETVYCPLTKKLQPVRPPKKVVGKISLDDFCAPKREKENFLEAVFESPNLFSLDENQLENLAFDFFQNGKNAFKNLPAVPNFPEQNPAKSFSSASGAGSFYNQISFSASKSERFGFSQNPRPPTFQATAKFDFQVVRRLEKISQNINPRSPPINLS